MQPPPVWPRVQALTIEPDTALGLLQGAPVLPDRASERQLVRRYADAMRRGEWLLNGETVVADADGALLDGRRRLQAAVLSETGFPGILVRFRRPSDGADAIDTGRRRSFADIVSVRRREDGEEATHAVSRRSGWIVAFVHRLLGGGPVATEQLRLMRLEQRLRPAIAEALEFADVFAARMPRSGPADVTIAAVFCIVRELRGPEGVAALEDVLGGPQIAFYGQLVRAVAGDTAQRHWARILLGHALPTALLSHGLADLREQAGIGETAPTEGPDPRDPSTAVLEWFVVSPVMAKAMLRRMAPNRRIGRTTVEAYARAMAQPGGWRLTGQSLKVDHLGRLFDGQHRCTAAIEARVGFPTLLVSNLSPTVFPTLDMQRRTPRSRAAGSAQAAPDDRARNRVA